MSKTSKLAKASATAQRSGGCAPATGSVQDVCKWVETELCAGMVLVPVTEADKVWNQAHQRAIGILRNYKRGEGLFQMTAPNNQAH